MLKRIIISLLLVLGITSGVAQAGKAEPINGKVFVNGTAEWGQYVTPVITTTGKLTAQQELKFMLLCYQGDPRQLVSIHSEDAFTVTTVQVPVESNLIPDPPVIDTTQPGRCRVSLLLVTSKGQTNTSVELNQHDWFDVLPISA